MARLDVDFALRSIPFLIAFIHETMGSDRERYLPESRGALYAKCDLMKRETRLAHLADETLWTLRRPEYPRFTSATVLRGVYFSKNTHRWKFRRIRKRARSRRKLFEYHAVACAPLMEAAISFASLQSWTHRCIKYFLALNPI